MKVDSEKSVQADSEKETEIIIPFTPEWRDRVLQQLRDDAADRLKSIGKERATTQAELAVVEERLLVVEAQLRDLAAERDKLKRGLFRLESEAAAVRNTLGGKDLP